MVEPAEHPCLPPDAAPATVRAGGAELQGDQPTTQAVTGSIDLGHHPAVERAEDVVARRRGAGHGLVRAAVFLEACDRPADAARPHDVGGLAPLPGVGQQGVSLVADDQQGHGRVLITNVEICRLSRIKSRSSWSSRDGGEVQPGLLDSMPEVLEASHEEIRQRAYEDDKDRLAWASEPIRPYVVVRLLATVYQRAEFLDDALDPEAAEAFAANVAQGGGLRSARSCHAGCRSGRTTIRRPDDWRPPPTCPACRMR